MSPSQAVTPEHVQLVLAAANTVDVESSTDDWATPEALGNWLQEHTGAAPAGTPARSVTLSAREHAAAVAVRDGLRSAIAANAAPDFGRDAAAFPLRVTIEHGVPVLGPAADGASRGVAQVLAAVARSAFDGTWERIKICPADDCQWAFFDQSRNRSRSWCSMRVCGNRTKTRSYRARHHQG